ncbi:class I SAM-dependent methyltransferase [Geminocystis sp. NIES-3709]|uniref:class I SAM-dependent methyltransferase n=1 Tax=Geminocystis sp. NIES-3709 TaxID=1617448 RepID=UPI0005FC4255|nr:class I SAM-dependent methyltransferase [Geminocystis sp. NIES-3709]BAQ64696.1 methyltransferase type 11 [Geminocystis sp. NIES-3709]
MDYKKFLELLPQVYNSIEQESIEITNDRFFLLSKQLESNINHYFLKLLNTAVICLEEAEIYCEITDNLGVSLISSLMNSETMGYGIIENNNINLQKINHNLTSFNCLDQVCIYEGDINNFCNDLKALQSDDKIGIFYIDGEKSYRTILNTLMSIRPFLAEEAFIIISHIEKQETKDAIDDFQTYNNTTSIHKLLTVNKDTKLYPILEQELVILLWQNNLIYKQINKINKQGLIKLNEGNEKNKKLLLHVGCGTYRENALPQQFRSEEWLEIRLDIDPNVTPDIIGTITDLSALSDNSVDAVFSSHNLEHIYNFEVPIALAEFKRVLKPKGFVMFVVPDMQTAAEWVVRGEMEDTPLYQSPGGNVPALWMFYGMGTTYPGMPYMAHKTGFTVQNLEKKLQEAGFTNLELIRHSFDIVAYGYKI